MKIHPLFSHIFISCAFVVGFRSPVQADQAMAPLLQAHVENRLIAGAVTLVADKEHVLDVTAVGYADLAVKKSMDRNALFWIASMSKPITAAALMILVDEGKVHLEDPVEKYLPEFKGQLVAEKGGTREKPVFGSPHEPKHPILVRNILSHTSGLPFKSSLEVPTLDQSTLAERVVSYAKGRLEFEPDSSYQYSNAGINTAGRIIEAVSGMRYEDFLQKRLLDPLGMNDTTFWPSVEQTKRLAKSYRPTLDKMDIEETPIAQLRYPLEDRASRFPMPAGGLFSTAADCARFCQMLLQGGVFEGKRILSSTAVDQLTRKQTAAEVATAYGYGFSTAGGNYGHGGAYGTNMTVDPKRGLITIFLIQNAGWRSEEGKKIEGDFRAAAGRLVRKE